MEPLFYSVILVGTVIFIVTAVKAITAYLLPKKDVGLCLVTIIPISGNNENIEYTVRKLLWNNNLGKCAGQHILLVLINADEETYKICEKLCEEYQSVTLCNSCDLESVISSTSFCSAEKV